jgi:hypothetical protein
LNTEQKGMSECLMSGLALTEPEGRRNEELGRLSRMFAERDQSNGWICQMKMVIYSQPLPGYFRTNYRERKVFVLKLHTNGYLSL